MYLNLRDLITEIPQSNRLLYADSSQLGRQKVWEQSLESRMHQDGNESYAIITACLDRIEPAAKRGCSLADLHEI